MKGAFTFGVMAGTVAGLAMMAAAMEAMHPGTMMRDGRKIMRKAKKCIPLGYGKFAGRCAAKWRW